MAGEDWVVQRFDHRCPYCDQVIVYESFALRPGENEMTCRFCRKVFIKVVGNLPEEEDRE